MLGTGLICLAGGLSAKVLAPRLEVVPVPAIAVPVQPVGPAPAIHLDPIRDRAPSRTVRRSLAVPDNGGLAVGGVDRLKLLFGDRISGRFLGFNEEGALMWKSPASKRPLELDAGSLARVELADRPVPETSRTHTCRLVMANEDELMGDLVEVKPGEKKGDATVILNTWYAGRLEIPLGMIQSIAPGVKGSRVVYSGPDSIRGWANGNTSSGAIQMKAQRQMGNVPFNGPVAPGVHADAANAVARIAGNRPAVNLPGWRYSKGTFHSQRSGAMLARNFELTDKVRIDFNLAWDNYFSFAFNFFTDKFSQYQGHGYQLRLDTSNAYLYRTSPSRGTENVGSNGRSGLSSGRGKARVSIFVDKDEKSFTLRLNDRLIKTWKDAKGFNGRGDGIIFISRNSQPIRISEIEITEWDGRLPEGGSARGDGKADFVEFTNKDNLSGTLVGIKRGRLSIDAGFDDPVEVPMERVGRIDLKSRAESIPSTPIRATLRNRGKLSYTLKGWADGKVRIVSPMFGEVAVDESMFSAIEFNLGKPRVESED
ncbi:MAG: hypothetical protein CMO66_02395 [Verrucomicrobiales bacterium]|nr:hypothetical protein [Verrucomicrobiales bacterium]